jgi:hypothetical protein
MVLIMPFVTDFISVKYRIVSHPSDSLTVYGWSFNARRTAV